MVPNMSASVRSVERQLKPFLTKLDKVSGPVFFDALPLDRTSADEKLAPVWFGFKMETVVDATQPIVPQLQKWIAQCASEIDIARVGVTHIECVRDCIALPRKKAGAA